MTERYCRFCGHSLSVDCGCTEYMKTEHYQDRTFRVKGRDITLGDHVDLNLYRKCIDETSTIDNATVRYNKIMEYKE